MHTHNNKVSPLPPPDPPPPCLYSGPILGKGKLNLSEDICLSLLFSAKYIPTQTVKENHLPDDQRGLVIIDLFRANVTEEVMTLLKKHYEVVVVPACCTDLLQPMDISVMFYISSEDCVCRRQQKQRASKVNKPFKDAIKRRFAEWYTEKVADQLKNGVELENVKVDTRLTVVKDLHLAWTRCAWAEIQNATIIAGFEKTGIIEAYKTALTSYDDVD